MSGYDIVVGIPTYKEEGNVSFVAETVAKGLKKHFPNQSCLIVNVDNNSPDNTKHNFLNAETLGVKKAYISTPSGVKGKGRNMKNLFLTVVKSGAKVGVTVDADLKSITPEWVKLLAQPILEGYDFITPLYKRNKFDGTITNHFIYPCFYGLLGKDLRQPIGGDFSFSPALAKHWLDSEWFSATYEYGIDVFMSLHAVTGNFRIGSAPLGSKVHKVKDPGEDLGEMLRQVVFSLFTLIDQSKDFIARVEGVEEVPVIGEPVPGEYQEMSINKELLRHKFIQGFAKQEHLFNALLPESTYHYLKDMFEKGKPHITHEDWSRLVYELLAVFQSVTNVEGFLDCAMTLYAGRVYSYAEQVELLSNEQAEALIRKQAKQFYEDRDLYLSHAMPLLKAKV